MIQKQGAIIWSHGLEGKKKKKKFFLPGNRAGKEGGRSLINEIVESIHNEVKKYQKRTSTVHCSLLLLYMECKICLASSSAKQYILAGPAAAFGRATYCRPPLPPSSHTNCEHCVLLHFLNHSFCHPGMENYSLFPSALTNFPEWKHKPTGEGK